MKKIPSKELGDPFPLLLFLDTFPCLVEVDRQRLPTHTVAAFQQRRLGIAQLLQSACHVDSAGTRAHNGNTITLPETDGSCEVVFPPPRAPLS